MGKRLDFRPRFCYLSPTRSEIPLIDFHRLYSVEEYLYQLTIIANTPGVPERTLRIVEGEYDWASQFTGGTIGYEIDDDGRWSTFHVPQMAINYPPTWRIQ